MTYINHDETHRGDDRGDARVSLYDHDARKSRIRDINIMNARVLLYDHDARIKVTDPLYNEPRTAVEGTHRSRRRRTTADDDAPRPRAATERRDACARRSIDRSRATPRRDATRRDATRIAHREISAFGGYDDCRHASNRIVRAERDATLRHDRGESRDGETIADVARPRARDRSRWNARSRARRDEARRRRRATTGRDDGTRRERRERRERCEGRER